MPSAVGGFGGITLARGVGDGMMSQGEVRVYWGRG